MIKNLKPLFCALLISFSLPVFSQGNQNGTSVADDSMRDLLIVGGTGAMGAVLGLSTLSFVGGALRAPKKHIHGCISWNHIRCFICGLFDGK